MSVAMSTRPMHYQTSAARTRWWNTYVQLELTLKHDETAFVCRFTMGGVVMWRRTLVRGIMLRTQRSQEWSANRRTASSKLRSINLINWRITEISQRRPIWKKWTTKTCVRSQWWRHEGKADVSIQVPFGVRSSIFHRLKSILQMYSRCTLSENDVLFSSAIETGDDALCFSVHVFKLFTFNKSAIFFLRNSLCGMISCYDQGAFCDLRVVSHPSSSYLTQVTSVVTRARTNTNFLDNIIRRGHVEVRHRNHHKTTRVKNTSNRQRIVDKVARFLHQKKRPERCMISARIRRMKRDRDLLILTRVIHLDIIFTKFRFENTESLWIHIGDFSSIVRRHHTWRSPLHFEPESIDTCNSLRSRIGVDSISSINHPSDQSRRLCDDSRTVNSRCERVDIRCSIMWWYGRNGQT